MRIRALLILSSLSPSTFFFISVGALSLAKFLPNRKLHLRFVDSRTRILIAFAAADRLSPIT